MTLSFPCASAGDGARAIAARAKAPINDASLFNMISPPMTTPPSGGGREIVAVRSVPRNHESLHDVDGDEEQDTDERQHGERGEHERQVEVAVGDLQEI